MSALWSHCSETFFARKGHPIGKSMWLEQTADTQKSDTLVILFKRIYWLANWEQLYWDFALKNLLIFSVNKPVTCPVQDKGILCYSLLLDWPIRKSHKVNCSCCLLSVYLGTLEHGLFCLGDSHPGWTLVLGVKHPGYSVGLYLEENNKRFPTVNKLSLCLNNRSPISEVFKDFFTTPSPHPKCFGLE